MTLSESLERIAKQYDQIIAEWDTVGESASWQKLNQLEAIDANNISWRINPESGNWQSTKSGDWADDDPTQFADHIEEVTDDFSRAGRNPWQDRGEPLVNIPGPGFSANPGASPWDPPVPPSERQQPVAPQPVSSVPDAGDWSREKPWDSEPGFASPAGEPEMQPVATHKRSLLSRLRLRPTQLIAVAVAVILAGAAYTLLRQPEGRTCPDTSVYLYSDVSGTLQTTVACVVDNRLIAPMSIDTDGVATFAPRDTVTRIDFAQTVGMTYRALGGTVHDVPAPPDYNQVPETVRDDIATAYALGLIENGPVLSNRPVTIGEAVQSLLRLYQHTDIGSQAVGATALVDAHILESAELDQLDGALTRDQLANWLRNLWESGAVITSDEANPVTTTERPSPTTQATSATTTSTPSTTAGDTSTTVEDGPADATVDDVIGILNVLASGSRSDIANIVVAPGGTGSLALGSAAWAGYAAAGIVADVSQNPIKGDDGTYYTNITLTDTDTGMVVGTGTAQLVPVDGIWKLANWPSIKPVDTDS